MAINFGGIITGIDQEWTRQIERKARHRRK